MRIIPFLLTCLLLNTASFAQSNPDDIRGVFSSRTDKDLKLYDGFNVEYYNYGYSNDTIYYKFYGKELGIPLSSIDLKNAVIAEEKKWMSIDKEKIWYLKLKPVKNKYFPNQLPIGYGNKGDEEVTFYFLSKGMAENALEFFKAPFPLQAATAMDDFDIDAALANVFGGKTKTTENDVDKMLAKKDDTDLEFIMVTGSPVSFKHFAYKDSLWFWGAEQYAMVICFKDIDISRSMAYQSAIWKNKDGSKAYEVPLLSKGYKLFRQDFTSEWGFDAVSEKKYGGKEISIAKLIMPTKELADKFIKYLKEKAN